MMKKIIKSLILLFLINTSSIAGKIADFKLNDLNNKRITYSEIKGEKLTILDFWATWCKPCSRAIPKLIELFTAFEEQGVQIIGISVDSPRNLSKVKPFVNSRGIPYPILLDSNSELMTRLQVTAMPTVLMVDEKDEIVFIHRGYRPGDEKILREEIIKLIEQKPTQDEDDQ